MRTIDVRVEGEFIFDDGARKIIYGDGNDEDTGHVVVNLKHPEIISIYEDDIEIRVWTSDIDNLTKALKKAQQQLLGEDDDEKF